VPGPPGIVLSRRMNALRGRSDHRKKERPDQSIRVFVADREIECSIMVSYPRRSNSSNAD
jgi:hypothetical protein